MVIEQYPDTIIITRSIGGSIQDEDGNWTTTPDEVLEFKCRFVPNGAGKAVTLQDGTNYTYSYKVAFPLGTTDIRVHDKYTRKGIDGTIKQFEVGQLHSVAWV